MFSVGGSDTISRDMSGFLFSSTMKHSPEAEFAKNREFISSDLYNNQQQQQSSGLLRYRSAPSSFFANLIDTTNDGGGGDDFLNNRSPSPESESIFATFMSCNDNSGTPDNEITRQKNLQSSASIKQETVESGQKLNGYSTAVSQMVYETSLSRDLPNDNSVSCGPSMGSYSMAMENPTQMRTNGGNCSNLIRQSNSPARFLSGFSVTRDMENFRASNGINGETGSSTSRMTSNMNFSSGLSSCSRFMPQIAENADESIDACNLDNGHLGNRNDSCYPSRFSNDSSFTGLKRSRDDDMQMFSNLNSQNGGSRTYTPGLTHHLSLTKTSAEMASIEKFLQFQQDSVPCKVRAKRGYATHPRSIAERMRRTRISERMRKLQELFPNMDKQTNTADMLDLAVEYIKDLQKEVQTLTDTREKCTCSSNKQK